MSSHALRGASGQAVANGSSSPKDAAKSPAIPGSLTEAINLVMAHMKYAWLVPTNPPPRCSHVEDCSSQASPCCTASSSGVTPPRRSAQVPEAVMEELEESPMPR